MKFSELPGAKLLVRVSERGGTRIRNHFELGGDVLPVRRVEISTVPNTFDLHLVDRVISVETSTVADAQKLTDELGFGRSMLAQISSFANDGSVALEACFFSGRLLDMDSIEIGVDEYVERRAHEINGRQIYDVHEWLREQSVFDFGGQSYVFLTGGPALLKNLDESEDESDNEIDFGTALASQFSLTGSGIRFVVTERQVPMGSSVWVATRMTTRRGDSDRAIRLATATVKFADWTAVGAIKEIARQQNAILNNAADSYLKKWDEFGSFEGEIFLEQVRRFGIIDFKNAVIGKDGRITIRLENVSEEAEEMIRVKKVTSVELVDSPPEHISDHSLSFEEYSRNLMRTDKAKAVVSDSSREMFEIVSIDRETRTMVLKGEAIAEAGQLAMATTGDTTQMKRRRYARDRIYEGRAANPYLGALIQPGGEVFALRSAKRVPPLTSFVRQKIFRNPPTLMQERAIDVALNTPDIALIQGPPGTGKTTVIAAILERLNERSAEMGGNATGTVLLSAFQQDAVENMIDRISLNGVPVPKFGRKSGSNEDDITAFERNLASWCQDISEQVRAKYPAVAEVEDEIRLNDLFLQYLKSPSRQLVLNMARRISDMSVEVVGPDVLARSSRLTERLEIHAISDIDRVRKLSAARQLRIHPESFADDGPEMAEKAITSLEDDLSDEEIDLLDRASRWNGNAKQPSFLRQLSALKAKLLTEFTAPPEFRVEKFNDDAIELVELVIERLRERSFKSDDKMTRIMAEFLSDLESNQAGMIDAISEYSFAFAATVQQSVNKEMQRRKGVSGRDAAQSLEYDYVIVDEAARVSPLDLMIPMSQGKKIILVGDHRQLPHVIDDEVARRMEAAEVDLDEVEWLKKSLFQYMFAERLKTLEESDGIQRRVTLDVQFRMHPVIGSFVSRNFYERFDPDEQFTSGLDPSNFQHHLSGTNGEHALWMDVPISVGVAERPGTSWKRSAEVNAIVAQLMKWLRSPEGAGLTFGVISFYQSQAEEIRKALSSKLGTEEDLLHRVRIGTVDSFQGMEFDVVFLSVVRTTPSNFSVDASTRESQARRTFGHLGLYNRLNVAMSRQKKLLVVVGEKTLFETDLAREFVPGLADFLNIAEIIASPIGESA